MDISVVIPLFNKEKFIVQAVNSVLSQKLKPKELIVVNDGSTDKSLELINEVISDILTDVSIRVFDIKNSGVSVARNMGVKKSNSEYIAFLDADDSWDTEYLFEMASLIEANPNSGMYSCNHVINRNGMQRFIAKCPLDKNFSDEVDFFHLVQKYSVVNSSKVIVNKKFFLMVGGFPEGVKYGEDLYLWIKMALSYSVCFVNKPLVTINQFPDESRLSRVNDILYPLLRITEFEYSKNINLKKYLLILFRNSFLFRIKEGNKRTAFETFLQAFKISPAYTSLFLPFMFLPRIIIDIIYYKHKKGR
ncbi:glycosyltransferase family 2 protein [Aeromonas veronii]